MFNNKTKLHLAIAWTLAFVFALSTLLLAIKVNNSDEPDVKVATVADFSSANTLTHIHHGSLGGISLMSIAPDARSSSYITYQYTDNTSSNNPSISVEMFSQEPWLCDCGCQEKLLGTWSISIDGVGTVFTSTAKNGFCTATGSYPVIKHPAYNATINLMDYVNSGSILANQTYKVKVTYYEFEYTGDINYEFTMKSSPTTVEVGTFRIVVAEDLPEQPTKVGYTFNGWYTDEACTQPYTDDKVYGNITLYAGFEANNYTVNFNANGGSGSMSALSMTYDTAKALPSNTFSKAGFYFAGWATSPNGSVVHANGASVKNLTATANGSVTLYAVWSELKYNIAFNSNGGSGSMSSLAVTGLNSVKLTPNTFVKEGHTFRGWATSPNGVVAYADGSNVSSLTSSNGSTVTLYAVWQLNVYDVIFVANDTNVASFKVSHGQPSSVPEVAPTKEGHSFRGWVLPDGTPYNGQNITSNTTITADFVANKVVVTFVIDGEATNVFVDWGTNLKALLDEHYPVLLYERPEVEENF